MAANRDEFHARPTATLNWWTEHPEILAGKDLLQGGTWCGVNRSGRYAAITNYREAETTVGEPISRGQIIRDLLLSDEAFESCLQAIDAQHDSYAGFNLLLGDSQRLFYYSNKQREIQPVSAGIHGLSNGLLDTPWPKLVSGKQALQKLLDGGFDQQALFDLLANRETAEDDCLPITGVSLEWERLLSARFIQSPDYGTRSSSLLEIKANGLVQMWERSFDAQARSINEVNFSFTIDR